MEADFQPQLGQIHPNYLDSARNLIHYLALRTLNLRDLQSRLTDLGLSSLSHSEGAALANLHQVIRLLGILEEKEDDFVPDFPPGAYSYSKSRTSLRANKRRLLGQSHRTNHTRIMVTLSSEAAVDRSIISGLLDAGMDVARINCSHDGPEVWAGMKQILAEEAALRKRHCPIYMDLAGPKLRTGPVEVRKAKKKKKKKEKIVDYLTLNQGDILHLHKKSVVGRNAQIDDAKQVLEPAKISLSLSEAFDDIQEGDSVFFDDGKIGSIVLRKQADVLILRITQAGLEGSKLKAEKGINFPNTQLNIASLTEDDYAVLPFIAEHADMVGYSFVREASDVQLLQEKLAELGREDMGIILKIETRAAFDNIPSLLLQAMQSPTIGVMIARGDLAVEVGWERNSEVQEELLWICEAAHVPTVWATQVLEKLAKKGVATRAEITDAAMASRAECIMLNKGPYITQAVKTLDNIISRMDSHQEKKKGMLRPLNVAKHFFELNQGII